MKPSDQTVDSVILIVDSDQLSRLTLRDMLDALGWEVTACSTVAEAVHALTQRQYQIAIFSSLPPYPHLLKSVTEMQSVRNTVRFLFLSGRPMSEEEQVLFDARLSKPIDLFELDAALRHVVSSHSKASTIGGRT